MSFAHAARAAGGRSTYRSMSSSDVTATWIGFAGGRPFAAYTASIAASLVASAASMYPVSVGSTASPPALRCETHACTASRTGAAPLSGGHG